MNKENGTITKVNKEKITYSPEPDKVETVRVDGVGIWSASRTNKFPAEKVEVLAQVYLEKKNETEDPEKMIETERIYEGFEIGIIKE